MSASLFEVRESPIAGRGAFANQPIRRGTRIVEYLGERISQEEADQRYDDTQYEHPHVLLFSVDDQTVIDAGVGGNEARFINHSCDPNCRSVTRGGRVHIYAIRDISPGDELTYDYQLTRDGISDEEAYTLYVCHCGSANCRGTMLAPK